MEGTFLTDTHGASEGVCESRLWQTVCAKANRLFHPTFGGEKP